MSLAAKLLSASGELDKLYVDDVFSAYLYTGNGSTQTINNGIDLAGKGGLTWIKVRNQAFQHMLFDTQRGMTYSSSPYLSTNDTPSQVAGTNVLQANADGFSFGTSGGGGALNGTGNNYASWTFRKAPKFFDVVTYTGNGVAGRQIPHALGITPGVVIVKQTSSAGNNWVVWHRSLSANQGLLLNQTDAQMSAIGWFGDGTNVINPTAAVFTVGPANGATNAPGSSYVAYLFAHDPSADGIIQCGSYTGNYTNGFSVDLGWEPQYLLLKSTTNTSNWAIFDSMRGITSNNVAGNSIGLSPNGSFGESSFAGHKGLYLHARGFGAYSQASGEGVQSATYIYLAIRRPNKPPTTGTQVYNAIARTGTGAAATVTGVGFAPDVVSVMTRNAANDHPWVSRLTGGSQLLTVTTIETEASVVGAFPSDSFAVMDGVKVGSDGRVNSATRDYINHFFKRTVGVFDQVCYTGTGVAKTEAHSLGVVPELMIVKNRTNTDPWAVYSATVGIGSYALLNSAASFVSDPGSIWNGVAPTANVFSVGITRMTNSNVADTHVAYLFASKPGISKVGSYTGNGTSQTIDCGFTTGARFVMIKRTDSTGDWYVWDTVRGLVAGNDPHMSLNSTTSEITTDDSLDPASVGFIVNQLAATNINVTSASYIYLSFA